MGQTALYNSFPPYAAAFRRHFGIDNDQALNLFHQTVSMKSVGNLTDFVREHMLEAFDVAPRIDALINHFDDLNRAHESVLRAKAQIERLTPLAADCDAHEAIVQKTAHWRGCREGLKVYFADLKADLIARRLEILGDEENRLSQKVRQLDEARRAQLVERDRLKQAIAENGGDRLERIQADLAEKRREKDRRRERADRYLMLVGHIGLPKTLEVDIFADNQNRIAPLLEGHRRAGGGSPE